MEEAPSLKAGASRALRGGLVVLQVAFANHSPHRRRFDGSDV